MFKNIKEFQDHMQKMKNDPVYKENFNKRYKQNKIDDIRNQWNNLEYMNNINDIPELPVVDEKEWKEYFIPILIKNGAIPKIDLIDGEWYHGKHRNCNFAKWNEKKNKFDHLRYKFGWRWDDCNHFEDDDGFALFVPIRKATKEEIKIEKDKYEIPPNR